MKIGDENSMFETFNKFLALIAVMKSTIQKTTFLHQFLNRIKHSLVLWLNPPPWIFIVF